MNGAAFLHGVTESPLLDDKTEPSYSSSPFPETEMTGHSSINLYEMVWTFFLSLFLIIFLRVRVQPSPIRNSGVSFSIHSFSGFMIRGYMSDLGMYPSLPLRLSKRNCPPVSPFPPSLLFRASNRAPLTYPLAKVSIDLRITFEGGRHIAFTLFSFPPLPPRVKTCVCSIQRTAGNPERFVPPHRVVFVFRNFINKEARFTSNGLPFPVIASSTFFSPENKNHVVHVM